MDTAEDGRAALESAQIITLPGQEIVRIEATPFVWRDPTTLPRQQFLYGFELQRGHLSVLVAPGAAGKSTYLMARALCMATGIARFKQQVWNGPHRVWLWNLEDKRLHLERMLAAFCLHFKIDPDDIGDRLFLDSAVRNGPGEGDYTPKILKLAVEEKGSGYTIQRPLVDALIAELIRRRIDHLDIDPFVSSHSVQENDNGAIDAVSKEWSYVAAEANCSISLSHHVRKFEGRDATAFDARGAVSIINTARSVLVINPMDEKAADSCGIRQIDRMHYFRIVDGKNNRAPATLQGSWFKKVGVGLGNGDATGPEDNVATIERYNPPNIWGGMKPEQLLFIQERIASAPVDHTRASAISPGWVGFVVAECLSLSMRKTAKGTADSSPEKEKVLAYLTAWEGNDVIRYEERKTSHGEMKMCAVIGTKVDPKTI